MQRMFHAVVMAGAVCLSTGLCPSGWAQEHDGLDFEARVQQLELTQLESEMAFENQMGELELEARRIEIDLMRDVSPAATGNDGQGVLFLVALVVHILMAIWVYSDNRRRDAGYGIWIVITLLAGFFGALVYAVIRLGDVRASPPAPARASTAKK